MRWMMGSNIVIVLNRLGQVAIMIGSPVKFSNGVDSVIVTLTE